MRKVYSILFCAAAVGCGFQMPAVGGEVEKEVPAPESAERVKSRALAEKLKSDDADVVAEASSGLRDMGWDATPALLEMFGSDNTDAKKAAARLFFEMVILPNDLSRINPKAVKPLLACLNDPSDRVRQEAVAFLGMGERESDAVLPAIQKVAKSDKSEAVRARAKKSLEGCVLGRLGELSNPDRPPANAARIDAAMKFAQEVGPDAIPALEKYITILDNARIMLANSLDDPAIDVAIDQNRALTAKVRETAGLLKLLRDRKE